MVGEVVNKTIRIGTVVVESQTFSKEMMNFAHYIDADFVAIDEVDEIQKLKTTADVGISYGFGLKFTKDVIEGFPSGILNIHTGDLPAYRSRHPVSWAMINGEDKIGVTIHKIDENIDRGHSVHKFFVERSFSDDLTTLQAKIENALKTEFPKAINKFRTKKFQKLGAGIYMHRIDKVFSIVDPEKISSKQLFSLFLSQKIYGGVNILGSAKLECHIYNEAFESSYEGYQIYRCADDILVAIK